MTEILLEPGEALEVGKLPDGSVICVKRSRENIEGEYQIVRKMPGGTEFTDLILEDGFITIPAAKERALYFVNMLKK